MRKILRSKIHRAFVTKADINYVGSISIDTKLLKAADISVYEEVQVVDITNGARLYTYAMPAPAGSGQIQINGAAAHLVKPNDIVIIMSCWCLSIGWYQRRIKWYRENNKWS